MQENYQHETKAWFYVIQPRNGSGVFYSSQSSPGYSKSKKIKPAMTNC